MILVNARWRRKMDDLQELKRRSDFLYAEMDMDTHCMRGRFNATAKELGLLVTDVSSDGWARTFIRDDGLHLWRLGYGVQTAWIDDRDGSKVFVEHRVYCGDTNDLALRAAMQREGRS